MTLSWIVILLGYGLFAGVHHIDPLMLLLLVPMAVQDRYDARRRR